MPDAVKLYCPLRDITRCPLTNIWGCSVVSTAAMTMEALKRSPG